MLKYLKTLSGNKIAFIGLAVVAFVISVIFLFNVSSPSYSSLYSNLSTEDRNIISAKLNRMGISHKVVEENSQILVHVDKVLNIRMMLAEEGLPTSGSFVGYEVFDHDDGIGKSSQFLNDVNLVRSLEGELSRTINSLAQIERSRIHIVLPKKELFSKSSAAPSASVVLKVNKGYTLSNKEISGIAYLIAKAVPDLSVENITILNSNGVALKLPNQNVNPMGEFTSLEQQNALENRMKMMLENMLESYVGIGKVRVNVTAKIDNNKEVIFSESYDPDGQVVRSKKTYEDKEGNFEEGQPITVLNNIPNSNQDLDYNSQNNNRSKYKIDDITNYEISKTVVNKVVEGGGIEKISIAVLVDGSYIKDRKDNTTKYQPRTSEELAKIKALVESAVGFDASRGDKIEVVNLEFTKDDEGSFTPSKNWFDTNSKNIIQMLIIGVIIILVILVILKPMMLSFLNKGKDSPLGIASVFSPKNLKENETSIEDKATVVENDFELQLDSKHQISRNKVNKFAEDYPEEFALIIQDWIGRNSI